MAMQSQGVQVRRQSTAAGSTASVTAATLRFTTYAAIADDKIHRSDVGSFITDGFTTGMRLETDSTANSTRIYTVTAVLSTTMVVAEPVITQSSGISFTITGHAMVPIGTVTGFNGPSGSANVIDVTHLGSTAKEKIIGIRDEGQLSLDVIYDSNATALHTAIQADMRSRTRRIYDIKLTDRTTAVSTASDSEPSAFYFDAYVSNFGLSGSVDDKITGSITLEISSAVRAIDQVT